MPPAFVLSQDQTLHIIFEFLAHSLTCLRSSFPKKLFELSQVRTIQFLLDSVFPIIWFCSLILQLFNFQRAPPSRDSFYILPHHHHTVNTFFILFSKIIFGASASADGDCYSITSSLSCQHQILTFLFLFQSYFQPYFYMNYHFRTH